MAHFYVVAQYVSPVLAWGFLGSDEHLKQVCEYFKVCTVDNRAYVIVKLYFICVVYLVCFMYLALHWIAFEQKKS